MKKIAAVSVAESRRASFDGELNRIFRELDRRGVSYSLASCSVSVPVDSAAPLFVALVLYEYNDDDGYVM